METESRPHLENLSALSEKVFPTGPLVWTGASFASGVAGIDAQPLSKLPHVVRVAKLDAGHQTGADQVVAIDDQGHARHLTSPTANGQMRLAYPRACV